MRLLAAVVAGVLLAVGLPPLPMWFLVPAGVAVLTWALSGRPWRHRFVLGAGAGLAFFLPTLGWLAGFTLAGFGAVLALEVLLFGSAMLLADPRPARWWTVPAALVALEGLRARFPFGGFPIPGMALGQLDGPFVAAAPLGGSLLVLGVAAASGAALPGLLVAGRRARTVVSVAVLAAAGTVGSLLAIPDGAVVGELRAVLVQGGGPRGIPAVMSDEQEVTERLFGLSADLPTGIDLVLWPESSLGVPGPVAGSRDGERVSRLAERTGATVVAGVTETEGSRFRNAAVAWGPDGQLVDRYEKVHRVPFGEYLPARGLFERLSDTTALVPRDAIPGRGTGLLRTPAGPLGVVISYEVFFADRARAAVTAGGHILLVPTNAASFPTDEVPEMQVAASRMRAREFDRAVLQAAPTGYTAVVGPGGDVVTRGGLGTPEVLAATVPLRSGLTVYARIGDGPVLAVAAILLLVGPLSSALRAGRRGRNLPVDAESPAVPRSGARIAPGTRPGRLP